MFLSTALFALISFFIHYFKCKQFATRLYGWIFVSDIVNIGFSKLLLEYFFKYFCFCIAISVIFYYTVFHRIQNHLWNFVCESLKRTMAIQKRLIVSWVTQSICFIWSKNSIAICMRNARIDFWILNIPVKSEMFFRANGTWSISESFVFYFIIIIL